MTPRCSVEAMKVTCWCSSEIDLVVARTPRAAVGRIAALLFQLVVKIFGHGVDRERRRVIADGQPDRRHRLAGVHLETALMRDEDRLLRNGAIDRRLVHANRDHRTQPEANRVWSPSRECR